MSGRRSRSTQRPPRQTGDQDRSTSWVRGRHSAHHAERHERSILSAQHQLSDPRHTLPVRALPSTVLADAPLGLRSQRGIDDPHDAPPPSPPAMSGPTKLIRQISRNRAFELLISLAGRR